MIHKASLFLAAALLLSITGAAAAQTTVDTPIKKFVRRFDLGMSVDGAFNKAVSGPIVPTSSNKGESVTEQPSNTVGYLVKLRYIARPYVGFEVNYGYARYNENFTGPGTASFIVNPFGVQSNAAEYSFGYVATPPHPFFGLSPVLGAGIGTTEFKPTARGGEGLPRKARATYYYDLGIQKEYHEGHIGLRGGFREAFFLAPDFGQNYLTILKHTTTYEPYAGFYFRY